MKLSLLCCLLIGLSLPALAAKNKDHWYKVESDPPKKEIKTNPHYLYDSVERDDKKTLFSEVGFWSLRPKLGLSFGFHADKAVFTDSKTNRFFIDSKVYFRNRPWHRVTLNVQVIQNNSAFVGANWEYTPERTASRNYYGLGVAHRLVSNKEFSNLVEPDSYYATFNVGREYLQRNGNAWFGECKGLWSGNNFAIQLSIGYIIPF